MPLITLCELQLFHKIDRVAYARLVYQLGLDSETSMKIVALWNWLETKGYRKFVHNSLNPTMSSFKSLSGLAMESILCLSCLDPESFLHDDEDDLELMSRVSDRELSLGFVYQNKEDAKSEVITFVRDVCERAFIDLVPTNNLDHQVEVLEPAVELLQPQVSFLRQEGNGSRFANRQVDEAGTDRILFATFSRGHPITREQLSEFFVGRYGKKCVEAIVMGTRDDQTLYARVIVKSPAYITLILGENEIMQFSIDNKDVRVRRFIRKRAPVITDSSSAK